MAIGGTVSIFSSLLVLRIIHQTFAHGSIITYEYLSASAEDSVQRSSDIKCCGTFLVVGRVVDEGLCVSRNDVHVHILHTQNASLLVGHYVQGKGTLHLSSLTQNHNKNTTHRTALDMLGCSVRFIT